MENGMEEKTGGKESMSNEKMSSAVMTGPQEENTAPSLPTEAVDDEDEDWDDDDDFADFAQAPVPPEAPAAVAAVPQSKSACDHDDDNDDDDAFADFHTSSVPTIASAAREPVPLALVASEGEDTVLSFEQLHQLMRIAFTAGSASDDDHCSVHPDLQSGGEISSVLLSAIPQSLVDNEIWLRLRKMSAMNSLNKFKWTNSHTFSSFTTALSVDPKLVERDGIPIFATHLQLLQPVKAAATAAVVVTPIAANISSDKQEQTSSSPSTSPKGPEVQSDSNSVHKQQNAHSVPVEDISQTTIATATTTSAAGLRTLVLDLDFLSQQQGLSSSSSSSSSKSKHKHQLSAAATAVSQLEQELLSDLKAPADGILNPGNRKTGNGVVVTEGQKLLQTLLTNASISSLPVSSPALATDGLVPDISINGSPAAVSGSGKPVVVRKGLSAEASQILDELPILSFLRSNLT